MGLKTFTIGDAREAFEIICDGDSHDDSVTFHDVSRVETINPTRICYG